MLIKNCQVIFLDRVEKADVWLKDGLIYKIGKDLKAEDRIYDGENLYLSPGFIDTHIHGAGGFDTMDGSYDALNSISKAVAVHGTTAFLATTMTCSFDDIKKALSSVKEAVERGTEGALVLGAHLEGPFISPKMIGAQNPKFIAASSLENFMAFAGEYLEYIKEVTIAPEINGSEILIKFLNEKGIVASIGHSDATYGEAMKGIDWGISHSTHLFNAMKLLHHREGGVVGAIFDSDITTEIICDGIHVDFPVVRIALKQKSTDKVLLVTDAMMACCMKAGTYSLGGQKVLVDGSSARLESGALAGSVLTQDVAVRNVVKYTSYPLHEIIKMVTYNAARHCNVQHKKGSIKEGFDADLVLFDKDINIKKVFVSGREVVL
ncbi:N-acetylglucosamine-6-phosphate deacetylase [Clostridium thermarum]|uniref:N-acetylglucosamine-6-phosphate deacetylase n=1 Tax=Clostridium thermarum TaxID=1716543 RepID=UPI0013D6769A|nr:N-acetylglucosamine-6-phosphate deacetylase [Clostridium thermarum]